jgi:diadenosine tetraphosphate (Ap4A) HIT family hydrolase
VIAQRLTDDRSVAPYVTEDVDDVVVVISEPELNGLLVIPRQHIGGLEGLSVPGRAHLLAALHRVKQSVQERNPGSVTRIVVMSEAPATEDHVCFHVTPGDHEDP